MHSIRTGWIWGIGRAPGGGPVEALALRRNRKVQPVDDFPEQVAELLAFLGHGATDSETGPHGFPAQHPFAGIRVSPEMPGGPDVWMLGSSMWSSAAAWSLGCRTPFAHFFSPVHTRAAIETYRGILL